MKDNVSFEDFAKLDIRVGSIVSVEAVPKSTKLLKFEISFGPEIGNRTILSGIAPLRDRFTEEPGGVYCEIGQKVMAVLNFPPRAMMGIESHGMLLSVKDKGRFWLTSPTWADDGTEVG